MGSIRAFWMSMMKINQIFWNNLYFGGKLLLKN